MQRPRLTQPIRFWMTGAIAVVMAALAGGRVDAAQLRNMQLSRYTVTQTVQRIEARARRHGLAVFVRVKQPASLGQEQRGDTLVLVLESSQGGTPVVMRGEGNEMRSDLPLSLEVRPNRDGSSEVWFATTSAATLAGMPAGLAADLADLPSLVADALA